MTFEKVAEIKVDETKRVSIDSGNERNEQTQISYWFSCLLMRKYFDPVIFMSFLTIFRFLF